MAPHNNAMSITTQDNTCRPAEVKHSNPRARRNRMKLTPATRSTGVTARLAIKK